MEVEYKMFWVTGSLTQLSAILIELSFPQATDYTVLNISTTSLMVDIIIISARITMYPEIIVVDLYILINYK